MNNTSPTTEAKDTMQTRINVAITITAMEGHDSARFPVEAIRMWLEGGLHKFKEDMQSRAAATHSGGTPPSPEPCGEQAQDLLILRDLFQHWLDWQREQRATENLTSEPDTHIICTPTEWPSRATVAKWIETIDAAAARLSGEPRERVYCALKMVPYEERWFRTEGMAEGLGYKVQSVWERVPETKGAE